MRKQLNGDYGNQLVMVWPEEKLNNPPVPVAAEGYLLRTYIDSDKDAFLELTHKAGFEDWNEERLENILKQIVPNGLFLIEHEESGTLAATSLCKHCPTVDFPFGGELGWVAGDPAHKGHGLGTAVCAAVVKRFIDAGYFNIYLRTDDWRLPALKTYIRIGFEPVIDSDDMQKRWETVYNTLGIESVFT